MYEISYVRQVFQLSSVHTIKFGFFGGFKNRTQPRIYCISGSQGEFALCTTGLMALWEHVGIKIQCITEGKGNASFHYSVRFYINSFVWRPRESKILSPLTIVEGMAIDLHKHIHVILGEHVHAFKGTTNTMKPITVTVLALGPSGTWDYPRRYELLELVR